jgi:citrate lyase beta subunit
VTLQRQPVHTVYGGAHLFTADIVQKIGRHAINVLEQYSPDARSFATLCGIAGSKKHLDLLYTRVVSKLQREPVEDYRIDFEDGFGRRSDAEEDAEAERTALATSLAIQKNSLPSFFGIRLKPLARETFERARRTLDIYLTTLIGRMRSPLPANFTVTLPKIAAPDELTAAVNIFTALESRLDLPPRSLHLEIMAETARAFFRGDGMPALPSLIEAADGRCRGIHLGPYDLTASLQVSSLFQRLDHPACDLARLLMTFATAGTSVAAVDGPTSTLPIGPHRALPGKRPTKKQLAENSAVIGTAWRLSMRNIRHALSIGLYQGWDLHPAQLPVRYAALYDYFLAERDRIIPRLKKFLEQSGQAVRSGETFDDAATVRGMLLFFRRGFLCGAFTPDDIALAGLAIADLSAESPSDLVINK